MSRSRNTFARLMCGAAVLALTSIAGAANAAEYDIAPQPLAMALKEFGMKTGQPVLYGPSLADAKMSAPVVHAPDAESALVAMLDGTGLTYRRNGDTFLIVSASDPQPGSAAGDGADAGTVAALVVTAQKREENIQDVPIAISAFTEKSLQEQKIEGGFDLLKAIPNVTFSKNNFTSYNFSIRGIGTKAVSATTDPGVAVAFNNAALIQNRLFEQEYFDVERVEVLRGPQGTLYGRNATAGVINVISAKPNLQEFSGWVKGEVGNYHAKRISAMVNAPLVEDKLGIRIAGALTDRAGYDFNDTTHHAVNGRDLWSGRITVGLNPTERIRSTLIWERFNEDDNRSRTGKQLCKRDSGPASFAGLPLEGPGTPTRITLVQGVFSQGCSPVSLYDDAAFQTPNGYAMPFIQAAFAVGNIGFYPGLGTVGLITRPDGSVPDPYAGLTQTRDLRVFNSVRDPIYRAKADVVQLSFDIDVTGTLKLTSQTVYDADQVYSSQDYNRFNTNPVFLNTSLLTYSGGRPSPWVNLAPGGLFCDPQIGCSRSIAGIDVSMAKSKQFLQELRLASSYDGPLNFSVGANYTRFQVLADYYVMFNLLTALAMTPPFNGQGNPTLCNIKKTSFFPFEGTPLDINDPEAGCPYVDQNPLESIDGEGHNYFRSKNPYKLHSAAAFGELYWQVGPETKLTLGLRYTDDRKTFTPVPSQLLLATNFKLGGDVNRGYPADPDIKQRWGEFTGRMGVDWTPELSFTDKTMLYAFYSRGYKGGGANPPRIGFTTKTFAELTGIPWDFQAFTPWAQNTTPTFKPEFVNAFEVGSKNNLLRGAMTLNAGAFFYDYKDYQVSKVVDRSVANENFDAKVWGLELEAAFAPSRNLRLVGNLGYLDTAIGKGARSIDVMNRTQGNPDWILLKPWIQFPSNCIAPKSVVENTFAAWDYQTLVLFKYCGDFYVIHFAPVLDPNTGQPYDPGATDSQGNPIYPGINGGAGFAQNLKGHELPNSPHWTANLGAQYSVDFADTWKATIRADGYWQSQSWARVYNAVNDKLHGWYNANLSLWLENDDGLKIEVYAKNILDKTPITDAFINSDDTGLTTNVFTLDPRLIGLSIKKEF